MREDGRQRLFSSPLIPLLLWMVFYHRRGGIRGKKKSKDLTVLDVLGAT